MAKEKKPVHKVQMTEGKRQIIQQLLQEYDIETAEDIQDALKDLLGGTIKEMMEAEMDDHLGYAKSERSDSDDYRNGYKSKRINSSYGSLDIEVPQDRKSTFEPKVVKKRQKDISDFDQKIISMYAKGMTTRQISDTLEDIYGFEASEGFISDVTDNYKQAGDFGKIRCDRGTVINRRMGSTGLWMTSIRLFLSMLFTIPYAITGLSVSWPHTLSSASPARARRTS